MSIESPGGKIALVAAGSSLVQTKLIDEQAITIDNATKRTSLTVTSWRTYEYLEIIVIGENDVSAYPSLSYLGGTYKDYVLINAKTLNAEGQVAIRIFSYRMRIYETVGSDVLIFELLRKFNRTTPKISIYGLK